jgi:hypothetical protein
MNKLPLLEKQLKEKKPKIVLLLFPESEPTILELKFFEEFYSSSCNGKFQAPLYKKEQYGALLTPSFLDFEVNPWYVLTHAEKAPTWLMEAVLRDALMATVVFVGKNCPSLKSFGLEIEKKGVVFEIGETKPWEKNQVLLQWLLNEEKKRSFFLEPAARTYLVDCADGQGEVLYHALNTLEMYLADEKKGTLEDCKALFSRNHFPIYEINQAILKKNAVHAIGLARLFLDQDISIFPLLEMIKNFLIREEKKNSFSSLQLVNALKEIHFIERVAEDSSIAHNVLIESLLLKLIKL